MHESITAAKFVEFNAPDEGVIDHLYLDSRGYPTAAMGAIANSASLVLGMPWVMPDGSVAPAAEVLRQWNALKAQPGLAEFAANNPRVLSATTMRLTPAGIDAVTARLLALANAQMLKAFSAFPSWPADAQLWAFSMCWAVGDGWADIFKNCSRVLRADPPAFMLAATPSSPEKWDAAADIRVDNDVGVIPRDRQDRLLLSNAQVVVDRKLDPSVLHWPKSPFNDGTADIDDEPTLPNV